MLKVAQRIIVIYCFIYSFAKIVAIFKGAWLYPHLLIMLGLLVLGGVGAFLILKKQKYSWVYTFIGVVLISALVYKEADLLLYLHEILG